MTKAIENLKAAQQHAMSTRPKVGGFPHLAETLRLAGVTRNIWILPACQATYFTSDGVVVQQGAPLLTGDAEIPGFDEKALIRALRTNQEGESTFPEFLVAAWKAGVVRYDVDFQKRNVTYYGCGDEAYVEDYPAVNAPQPPNPKNF